MNRVYLYKDGLVRFATERYNKNQDDVENPYVHLTNYAINRNNRVSNANEKDGSMGSTKWTLKTLWKYFDKHGDS